MQPIQVQAGPSYYECQQDVLQRLEPLMQRYGFQKALVIHGEKSWQAVEPFFPVMAAIETMFVQYSGHCSETEIKRVAKLAYEQDVDVVIGIGGGMALDLTKAVANQRKIDVVLIPTLVATCAAWTSLSVIYDDDDRYVKFQVYPRTTLMVLIEPRVIINSPAAYLRAGIADTLAKWYEARALSELLETKPVSVQLALITAKLCKDRLLEFGVAAIAAVEKGIIDTALTNVIETNILAGGLVGGLGDHYGRIAGAHSVHNALTQFHETHHLLHGEKVAYGILVQLALEKKATEIDELRSFYEKLQLPISLADLGLDSSCNQTKQKIAVWTLKPHESIHWMSQSFTAEEVIQALEVVETYSLK